MKDMKIEGLSVMTLCCALVTAVQALLPSRYFSCWV